MFEVEKDIRERIFLIKQRFEIENGKIVASKNQFYKRETEGFMDYANSLDVTKFVFANLDYDKMLKVYKKRVKTAASLIRAISKNHQEEIINTLEYMRIMTTYDYVASANDHSDKNIINIAENLEGSGLNAAITGRGNCQSQASYCRDILNELGIEARVLELGHKNVDSHADVLIANKIVVDPTNYVGTIESIAGGHLYEKYNLEQYNPLRSIDQKDFSSICKKMQVALIEYLGISNISELLNLKSYDKTTRQFMIWVLIGKMLTHANKPINSYTINLKGHEIEITRLVELFYIENGISYKRSGHIPGKFEGETYDILETILDSEKVKIVPRQNISAVENKKAAINPFAYTQDMQSTKTYKEKYKVARDYIVNNYFKVEDLLKRTPLKNDSEKTVVKENENISILEFLNPEILWDYAFGYKKLPNTRSINELSREFYVAARDFAILCSNSVSGKATSTPSKRELDYDYIKIYNAMGKAILKYLEMLRGRQSTAIKLSEVLNYAKQINQDDPELIENLDICFNPNSSKNFGQVGVRVYDEEKTREIIKKYIVTLFKCIEIYGFDKVNSTISQTRNLNK